MKLKRTLTLLAATLAAVVYLQGPAARALVPELSPQTAQTAITVLQEAGAQKFVKGLGLENFAKLSPENQQLALQKAMLNHPEVAKEFQATLTKIETAVNNQKITVKEASRQILAASKGDVDFAASSKAQKPLTSLLALPAEEGKGVKPGTITTDLLGTYVNDLQKQATAGAGIDMGLANETVKLVRQADKAAGVPVEGGTLATCGREFSAAANIVELRVLKGIAQGVLDAENAGTASSSELLRAGATSGLAAYEQARPDLTADEAKTNFCDLTNKGNLGCDLVSANVPACNL